MGNDVENKIPIFFGKKDALAKNEGLYIDIYYTGSINSDFKIKGIIKGADDDPIKQAIAPTVSIFLTVTLLLIVLLLINSIYLFYLIDFKINQKNGYTRYLKIGGLSILTVICLTLFITTLNEHFSYNTYVPNWLPQASLSAW